MRPGGPGGGVASAGGFACDSPMTGSAPYYRGDLALVHDLGFGFHADRCAPGILALLQPVLQRRGLVLELGCGTGLLTRYLVDAGHRVIATDASPAMLNRARQAVPEVKELRQLLLPDDPLPRADAVVAIGHVLNYLSDEAAVARAADAMAGALRPGGVLAFDLCDLQWGVRPAVTAPTWHGLKTTGRSSRGSRCRNPTDSFARSRPSSATRTAAGAATTSGTTTSSSTPRRSWGCSEAAASTWSLGPHSASSSSLPDS